MSFPVFFLYAWRAALKMESRFEREVEGVLDIVALGVVAYARARAVIISPQVRHVIHLPLSHATPPSLLPPLCRPSIDSSSSHVQVLLSPRLKPDCRRHADRPPFGGGRHKCAPRRLDSCHSTSRTTYATPRKSSPCSGPCFAGHALYCF